jgi:acyl dehydratase
MNPPEPATFDFASLAEGQIFTAEYTLSEAVYAGFLGAFDDRSPIHVDEDEARRRGFAGRVMHGAILHGFLSHFVGMVMPGRHALLLSTELKFLQPSYLDDVLRLTATIAQKVEAVRTIVVTVSFENVSRQVLAARGKLSVQLAS